MLLQGTTGALLWKTPWALDELRRISRGHSHLFPPNVRSREGTSGRGSAAVRTKGDHLTDLPGDTITTNGNEQSLTRKGEGNRCALITRLMDVPVI